MTESGFAMRGQETKGAEKLDVSSEFAPALDVEPVFDRPERFTQSPFKDVGHPPGQAATGVWADGRSSFGLEAEGGPGFLDPGSFALGAHRTDMMSSTGISNGAVQSASSDLSTATDFGGGDGGGGGSGKRGGGGVWSGGAPGSGTF